MLDQIRCQVSELDGGGVGLIGAIEQVDQLLDEVFSCRHGALSDNLLHDLDELVQVELLTGILIKLLCDVK